MINIFWKNFLRGKSLNLRPSKLNKELRQEFTTIKGQFEEHLQAINENSNELAANYEYLCELEAKLDRLNARIDNIQMSVNPNVQISRRFDVQKLNRMEQQVFLVIYTLEGEKSGLTYRDIAEKVGISEELAANYVTSIIQKGVPIVKRYLNLRPFLRLDPEFKSLQAKENILQLSLQEFF